MKKYIALVVMSVLLVSLLSGCAGTVVVINECDCPTHGADVSPASPAPAVNAEGALKTGLALVSTAGDSTSASEGKEGAVKFDITVAAVTVDENGVIHDCYIDSIPATLKLDAAGRLLSDKNAPVLTKNELGADYGMKAHGGAIAEWDEQAAALCEYAIGKTVEEWKNGAIDESGRAPDGSDLASSATIYLGGYVSAIEAAANNAQFLGAQAGDELRVVTLNSLESSADASQEAAGNAQLDANVAVLTAKDGVITSCIIDAVQAKIAFDASGVITSDLTAPILSKNALGENYGMKAWGGARAEWNEQAAAFSAYVTGKTAAEVAGIAVSESAKPADGSDLASSVTISVGGFQQLIEKALSE